MSRYYHHGDPNAPKLYCHCGHEEDDHMVNVKGKVIYCEQCECDGFK